MSYPWVSTLLLLLSCLDFKNYTQKPILLPYVVPLYFDLLFRDSSIYFPLGSLILLTSKNVYLAF